MAFKKKNLTLAQLESTLNSYKKLNSYLTHNLMSSLNTVSLGLDLLTSELVINENLSKVVLSSLNTALELLKRTNDLEKSIQFEYEILTVLELLEISTKEYLASDINFKIMNGKNEPLPSYFDSVFSSYFRYTINYRRATKIDIEVIDKGNNITITINDNGRKIPDVLINYLAQNEEFDNLVHNKSDIDIFITNVLLSSKNIDSYLINNPLDGCKFIIFFNN